MTHDELRIAEVFPVDDNSKQKRWRCVCGAFGDANWAAMHRDDCLIGGPVVEVFPVDDNSKEWGPDGWKMVLEIAKAALEGYMRADPSDIKGVRPEHESEEYKTANEAVNHIDSALARGKPGEQKEDHDEG